MMKQKLLLFATLIVLSLSCISQNTGNKFTIDIHESLAQDEQWVYLYAINDQQAWFIDSLFLEKGQTHFVFDNVNTNNPYNNRLDATNPLIYVCLSNGKGVITKIYDFADKFNLNITIDSLRNRTVTGTGGDEIIHSANNIMRLRLLRQKTEDTLNKLRKNNIPKERISYIKDSLDAKTEQVRVQYYIDKMDRPNSNVAYTAHEILKDFFGYTDNQLAPYMAKMKERFPKDSSIQLYPKSPVYPPATEGSIAARKRFKEIVNSKNDKTNVIVYKVGDIVQNLSLPDSTGVLITLNCIKTPYILIDFWASWCAPCRELAPTIKQLLHDNKQSLTIYAISIDKSRESWLKAIDADQTQQFTHVISDQNSKVIERFNIRAIPASYLLDSNHKIIGINLSEEQIRGIIQK